MRRKAVVVNLNLPPELEADLKSRGSSRAALAAVTSAHLPRVLAGLIALGFQGARPDGPRRPRRVAPETWAQLREASELSGVAGVDILRACVLLGMDREGGATAGGATAGD